MSMLSLRPIKGENIELELATNNESAPRARLASSDWLMRKHDLMVTVGVWY